MNELLKQAKMEFEVAENQFNWATGDAVDGAIEKYNAALLNYNKVLESQGLDTIS